jgi:hypothetical protein
VLGDAESSLGDAKSSLGDAKGSLGECVSEWSCLATAGGLPKHGCAASQSTSWAC